MKQIIFIFTVLFSSVAYSQNIGELVVSQKRNWSGKLGLDAGSFGGLVVHDFRSKGTLAGIQWDMLHILYSGKEVAELGSFVVQRDNDKHLLAGPSFGTAGAGLGTVASNIKNYFDWPILSALEDVGKYVHAYINVGWDLSRPNSMHLKPELVGLGGVVKFGVPKQ